MRYLFLICIFVLCLAIPSAWAAPKATSDNPRPAAGDIVLPLPGEAQMVFRQIPVPGSGFWGTQEQIIQIGDASGGVFEGLQRTQICGSFSDQDTDQQFIYLAKYELTKGQFAAVMGLKALAAMSGNPEDAGIAELQGRRRMEALMQPLSFVGYLDLQEFIRRFNQWLFDPQHPERLENMPKVDGVPGFLRLPTEEEWEFTARGGLEALADKTFQDRLPFAQREMNEQAWHLGNAKHKVRPIGLRQPSRLGMYDMFGNVQEMTAGLFRPEVWQGKPGGISVRGGSVSTPPQAIRSSLRQEMEIYAWNQDSEQVEERRSFNTGARLGIGSNVVINSRIRAEIEQEYEQYKEEIRRAMPVGRTLDNLVAQAAGQLGDVEPILDKLMQEHPNLSNELLTVQEFMDQARQRLDQAQKENARSLAQDAARNGVNVSVYISRLKHLQSSLEKAKRLAEMSSRYVTQVKAVEERIVELEAAQEDQIQGYVEKVGRLGEYEPGYIQEALETLQEQDPLPREEAVLTLLGDHVLEFSEQRRADREGWSDEFAETFAVFGE
ncbi:MAG: SUMF1/EgtB/PvdO family nonheme iron enzyme [Desulfovermiculus sp.]|nr:SUMF1/EgtB/PvdO family nonheme iron enzyme [Desulfovermiculus sp.]